MRKDDQTLLAACVGFGLLFLGLMAFPHCAASRAGAQIPAVSPTVALGRTFVRESGLVTYRRDDGTAIHAVVSFRAEHIYRSDYMTALRRATRNAFMRTDLTRPWIAHLSANGLRPPLWPGYLRWDRDEHGHGNARHWRRTLTHAREVLRGEIAHRCRLPTSGVDVAATPHSWGSEHDAIGFRRDNPDAVELDCGQTCAVEPDGSVRLTADGLERCNHFFHLPRYEARFGEI